MEEIESVEPCTISVPNTPRKLERARVILDGNVIVSPESPRPFSLEIRTRLNLPSSSAVYNPNWSLDIDGCVLSGDAASISWNPKEPDITTYHLITHAASVRL